MIIYKTTNILNGKYYIGKDRYNIPNYIGSGKIFLKALKKYDKSLWIKRVIDTADTDDEAYLKEIFWIEFYDSTNRNKGYNLSVGGKNPVMFGDNNHMTGRSHTEETKEKIRKKALGRPSKIKGIPKKPESIARMRATLSKKFSGEGNPFFGKHHSEETKRKHSELMYGIKIPEERKKKISESLKGRIKSEEEKNNISKGLKGVPKSEDHKRNMRHPHKKGYIKTEEHLRNIKISKELKKQRSKQ